MSVQAVQGVGSGSSLVPGNIAGLGREAMIANFLQMIDEWLAMLQAGSQASAAKSAAPSGNLPIADMLASASSFNTYKPGPGGQSSAQKIAGADIAATLLLAVA